MYRKKMQNKKKRVVVDSYLDGDIKMVQRAHLFNHAISLSEQSGGPDKVSSGYFDAFVYCYHKGWGSD
jgi:hypothetical protein